jgi:hypothetical protein
MRAVLRSPGAARFAVAILASMLMLSSCRSCCRWRCGVLLYAGLQPLSTGCSAVPTTACLRPAAACSRWAWAALTTVVVPLIAMLAAAAADDLTSLLFIGVVAMPAIGRHVGRASIPPGTRKGGSFLGSLGVIAGRHRACSCAAVARDLPLYASRRWPCWCRPLLWGWLTARVMATTRWPTRQLPKSAARSCAPAPLAAADDRRGVRRCWARCPARSGSAAR